jgi:hypothetical protein
LAIVDARCDAETLDIGLSHEIRAKHIAELLGLLKVNSQLGVLNSERSAVLRGGGVFCTDFTENSDSLYDERAKRTLFIASNGEYLQNSRLVAASNGNLISAAHEEFVKAGEARAPDPLGSLTSAEAKRQKDVTVM